MSKHPFHIILASIVGLMLVFGDAFFLFAQETATEEFTLEEITVTAQKREEDQQRVPIAMEVISGEQLEETGQNNVNEILKNISNAIINMTDEGMRVTVRGVNEAGGAFGNMRVQTPTVALNFDGVYNTEDASGQNLFDVERVEILYGPQSTMYGSNSPGGIVNIITTAPKTDKYSASGSVEYGSFNLLNANIALNAPIVSDKVAMRLSGQRSKHGSWVASNDNASTSTNLRLKTLYKPNEDLNLTLTGTWGKMTSGGMMGGSVEAFVDQDDVEGTPWDYVSEDTGGGGPAPMAMSFIEPTQGPPPGGGGPPPGGGGIGADRITKAISTDISWDTPLGSLSILPSYSKSQADDTSEVEDMSINIGGTMVEVDTVRYSENWTKQKSAEVRMTSSADFFFTWILGGTYYHSRRENNTIYNEYPDENQSGWSWEKNKGIYGNITYPFTSKFRGTAGYRYSWDDYYNKEDNPKEGTTGITGVSYSAPDYKIGMEYALADNHMLFANYATSYRIIAKGSQHSTNPDRDYWRKIPPEELKSYTIGSKSRFLGNKLQVNASAYFYDYKNREFPMAGEWSRLGRDDSTIESDYLGRDVNGNVVEGAEGLYPDFNNDGEMDTTTYSGNIEDYWGKQVGKYEAFGLDLSTSWLVTSKDRLDFSLSYMHTKWTEATVTMFWWWLWVDEAGNQCHGQDFSGVENTYSPTWAGTIAYQHNFMLGSWGTLVPHVDIQFKSEYRLNLYTDAQVAGDPDFGPDLVGWNRQEPYYLVDGNINFTHLSGKWTLNAYVKNATNYAVKTTLAGGGPTGGNKIGLNDPRSYGAVLSVKF